MKLCKEAHQSEEYGPIVHASRSASEVAGIKSEADDDHWEDCECYTNAYKDWFLVLRENMVP